MDSSTTEIAGEIERIVCESARRALRTLSTYSANFRNPESGMMLAMTRAIKGKCFEIFRASRDFPKIREIKEQGEPFRQYIRKQLADELRAARREKRKILGDISDLQAKASALTTILASSQNGELYPSVPPPALLATRRGQGVPIMSGIYFVWRGGIVAYVGQSINLNARLRTENHHVIESGDWLSFLPFPRPILNYAEAFYIGLLMPKINFGAKNRTNENQN